MMCFPMMARAQHIPLMVHGQRIDFHIFIDVAGASGTVARLLPFLERMPAEHLAVLYPIFVIERLPKGGLTGGTWRPREVPTRFMHNESNTQVPDIKTQALAVDRGKGLIGIPRNRWLRDHPEDTVLHEIGHCVDYSLHIVGDGDTLETFRGVRYPEERVGEYAAEAYARYILYTHRICREGSIPSGENQESCTRRLTMTLRASRAFDPVPNSWRPR
jgi:hypothetical protein